MKKLPVYAAPPLSPINTTEALARNDKCDRCELHAGVKNVCMKPEIIGTGEEVVVLVGEKPSLDDDMMGRPFVGASGRFLRELLKKHAAGKTFVLTNAWLCAPGGKKIGEAELNHTVEACQGYLRGLLRDLSRAGKFPARIITLGKIAAMTMLGRKVPIMSSRQGYGWWTNDFLTDTGEEAIDSAVPVFIMMNPADALRNRFHIQYFKEDIAHALTFDAGKPEHWGKDFIRCEGNPGAYFPTNEAMGPYSFDVETWGKVMNPDFQVVSLAITQIETETTWVFERGDLEDPACMDRIRALMEDESVTKVGHNVPYDLVALAADPVTNIRICGDVEDTLIERKLIQADADASLDECAELFGMGGHKEEAEQVIKEIVSDLKALAGESDRAPLKSGKERTPVKTKRVPRHLVDERHLAQIRKGESGKAFAYGYLPEDIRTRYNALDTITTARLKKHLVKDMSPAGRKAIYEEVTKPAIKAFSYMTLWGMPVDKDKLSLACDMLDVSLTLAQKKLDAQANINWNSPPQVAALFYDKLGFPQMKKGGELSRSTDEPTVDWLIAKGVRHPVLDALLEHRGLAKLSGQYFHGMWEHIRSDGRIHPSYNLSGTGTGRASASDPNVFNFPNPQKDGKTGPKWGYMVRDFFTARPGYVVLEVDMAQQEFRIAAKESGDKVMIDLIVRGEDPHMNTARTISFAWGMTPEQITKKERSDSKVTTFGALYGKTVRTIARDLNCSIERAQAVLDAILNRYEDMTRYITETREKAIVEGGVWSWWNGHEQARWRPLPDVGLLGEENEGRRIHALNGAVNMPIQGLGADYVTASLWPITEFVKDVIGEDCRVMSSVYDSVLVEVKERYVRPVAQFMKEVLTGWNSEGVPLGVDFKVGPSWGAAEDYHL